MALGVLDWGSGGISGSGGIGVKVFYIVSEVDVRGTDGGVGWVLC